VKRKAQIPIPGRDCFRGRRVKGLLPVGSKIGVVSCVNKSNQYRGPYLLVPQEREEPLLATIQPTGPQLNRGPKAGHRAAWR